MTAAQIAKCFGHTKIRINYLFSELLQTRDFDENPLPSIAMSTKDKKELSQRYLDGVEFEDSGQYFDEINKIFPESRSQGYERTK